MPMLRRMNWLLAAAMLAAAAGCATGPPPSTPTYTSPPPPLSTSPAFSAGTSTKVTVAPAEMIAPVGSEVVVLASVCQDGYLMANQQVTWNLADTTSSRIVDMGMPDLGDRLLNPFNWPRRVSEKMVVGVTLGRDQTLPRGTRVRRGQAWVSVTSPQDGTSVLTAQALGRQQTATIHWIDAQWVFPSPGIVPAGTSQVLTTTVSRLTNQAPLAGWIVRYAVEGGPAAGFAPEGAQVVEVTTDAAGQATAELTQSAAAGGTSVVQVQIIRPPQQDGRRLVVGQGSVQTTWSGADHSAITPQPTQPSDAPPVDEVSPSPSDTQIEVTMTAPREVQVGDTVTFEAVISNRSDQPAVGLLVKDRFDVGLEHEIAASPIERDLGDLAAGESVELPVTFRVSRAGVLNNRLEVLSGDRVLASAERSITAVQPPAAQRPAVRVEITGPETAQLGEQVTFTINVTNTGDVELRQVKLTSRLDKTLRVVKLTEDYESRETQQEMEYSWTIAQLPPGRTVRGYRLICRSSDAGRACNRVAVASQEGAGDNAEACVQIAAAAPEQPAPEQPAPGKAELTMTVTELVDPITVGGGVTYFIRVTNSGEVPQTHVTVEAALPVEMAPARVGTNGPTRFQVEGRAVRFNPLTEIRPGETFTYRVRAQAERPGTVTLRVTARSDQTPAPVVETEETIINEAQP